MTRPTVQTAEWTQPAQVKPEESKSAPILHAIEVLGDCEPDADRIRDVLLRVSTRLTGAVGAAIFETNATYVECPIAVDACRPMQRLRLPRSDTLVGLVTSTRSPMRVDFTQTADGRDADHCRELGFGAILLLPLRRGREVRSVVMLAFRDQPPPDNSETTLQPLIRVAAARLEHLALASERAADEGLLAAVAKAGREVLTSDNPQQALCDCARALTGAAYTSFLAPNHEGDLVLTAQSGATLPTITLPRHGPSLVSKAFATGHAQIVRDYKAHPEALARVITHIDGTDLAPPRSAAYIPVRAGDELLGVISLLLDEVFVARTTAVLGLVGILAAEAGLAIDRDRLRHELEQQARTDALTGVANRREWVSRLSQELARSDRQGEALSLILIDLDHFKAFNDAHGHHEGDRLLRTVTSGWLSQLRETDLLARLGGDEFAILLPATDAERAAELCERLFSAMPDDLTASAGIAEWNSAENQAGLYRRCDAALYKAKRSGRQRARLAG
jgi:diguanylate cyclase (GGDEF)-like protein